MLKHTALLAALSGCWIIPPDDPPPPDPTTLVEVATVTPNLDLLFLIDDSGSMADKQQALRDAFPTFLTALDAAPGGRPNLHLGVITPDMGTKSRLDPDPHPGVGTVGQGGCAETGKNGELQINGAPIVPNESGETEPFLAVSRDGTHNVTGTLADAFNTITRVGATGCGFEQQLHAMRVSLENTTANAGFLRPDANLAVIMLTDEDDCSLSDVGLFGPEGGELGPQQSFRCFRFGVTCDEDTNSVGAKTNCRPNAASDLVEDVAPFAQFLAGVKSRPDRVLFGAMMGVATPVAVELRTIGGNPIPALAHTCDTTQIDGPSGLVADPAVRLAAMATQFGELGGQAHVESICSRDLSPQVTGLAAKIAGMVDNVCLTRTVPAGTQCFVEETSDFQPAPTSLPACTGDEAPGASCFAIVDDAACSSGQRLDFVRSTPPVSNRSSTLRCAL